MRHATVKETIGDTGWSQCDSPAVSALEDCIHEHKDLIALAVLNAAASATGRFGHRYHRSIGGGRPAPFAGFTFKSERGHIAIDIPHFIEAAGGRELSSDVAAYAMGEVSEEDITAVIDAFIAEIRTAVQTVRNTS